MSKILNTCISKGNNNKAKRQPKEREKIFVNHISDKRLTLRIFYKELLKFKNNLIKK